MKHCHQIQQQFDERLDGRLDAPAAAAFDAHLAGCASCRAAWAEYAGAWRLLQQLPAYEPSAGFVERTLRQLDAPAAAPQPAWWSAWRWGALTTAAAAVLLAVWAGWMRWAAHQQAMLYAEIRQADFLEDFDVIASLDELQNGEANL